MSARGSRPPCLGEPRGPQDRDQLRTVEQTADYAPMVRILDAPVAQMVDRPLVLLAAFDVLLPEQVIEVPKISTPTRCPRTALSVPQTAEQLVEFPNVVSLIDVIRHAVEQTVGGGRIGGLPGFVKGMYPAPHIHEHFTIHKWLRQTAYILTHNLNMLEHIANNGMNTTMHTDANIAQF